MGTKEYRKGTQAKAKTGHPRQAQHLTECLNLVTGTTTKRANRRPGSGLNVTVKPILDDLMLKTPWLHVLIEAAGHLSADGYI